MKKETLLIAGLFFSIVSVAQRITYGASAGITIYNLRGAAVSNLHQVLDFTNSIVAPSPVTGYYVGAYTNIPVAHNLSVEPGIFYSQKGYQFTGSYAVKEGSFIGANASVALRTSYVELPVLLKADINGLQIFAGPQLSYLATAKLNTKASIAGFSIINNSMDASSHLHRWDVGITGGIGYRFTNAVRLSASYERGFSKTDAGKSIESFNLGIKIGAAFSL